MSVQSLYNVATALSRLNLGPSSVCLNCRIAQRAVRAPPQRLLPTIQARNASHAAAGVANGPKNRPGRRLGAKRGNGEYVTPNTIIFRQRGSKWHPGENAGMGRDHTIVARQPGYVRYYQDPARHPDRKYIGIVYNSQDQLPYPPNSARKRRLGLVAVKMSAEETLNANEGTESITDEGATASIISDGEFGVHPDHATSAAATPSKASAAWPWDAQPSTFTTTDKNGNVRSISLRGDGSYRLSNREIGQAAESARSRVAPYVKDRFLAWRKASARKTRNALAKSAGKRKSKKAKK